MGGIKLHIHSQAVPDSKVHGANMGPTWVLSVPDGPHVGPMNLPIRGAVEALEWMINFVTWTLFTQHIYYLAAIP